MIIKMYNKKNIEKIIMKNQSKIIERFLCTECLNIPFRSLTLFEKHYFYTDENGMVTLDNDTLNYDNKSGYIIEEFLHSYYRYYCPKCNKYTMILIDNIMPYLLVHLIRNNYTTLYSCEGHLKYDYFHKEIKNKGFYIFIKDPYSNFFNYMKKVFRKDLLIKDYFYLEHGYDKMKNSITTTIRTHEDKNIHIDRLILLERYFKEIPYNEKGDK